MITETSTRNIEPDITVYAISGRLNLGNSLMTIENSIKRLIDEGVKKLVVDLGGLNFIDSSGIGMLVTCCGHMEQRGGRMRVAGAQGPVGKALGLVHFSRLAPLDADADASAQQLKADAATA
jgi:anti-sigma B factor antagonist